MSAGTLLQATKESRLRSCHDPMQAASDQPPSDPSGSDSSFVGCDKLILAISNESIKRSRRIVSRESGGFTQTGMISVDGMGNLAEHVGVSFANPLTAALLATIQREVATAEDDNTDLAKAMLLHSALLRGVPKQKDFNYYGFGKPPDVDEILHCVQSEATVLIQANLVGGHVFSKSPFPIPRCLVVDGKVQCEIFMTLVYEPPLDARYGVEYCRVNVDAKLGSPRSKLGKDAFKTEVQPVPKWRLEGHERLLVKEGFKWSPVKAYYRKLSRFSADINWELRLEMSRRANEPQLEEQTVYLLLTLRDLTGNANVYDELVQEMTKLAWGPQDLRLRSRQRAQN